VEQEFLKPRLIGERFKDHTVPLEMLKDFSALQDMLVEVAKWEFKRAHPDRVRIPRNFAEGVDLHLTAVGDGSAVLTISLIFGTLVPTSRNLTYFESARAAILDSISLAESGSAPNLPPDLLEYFDRFGRGLRPGESVEFQQCGRNAVLTPDVRQELIRYSQRREWTEDAALRVRIPEADKGRGTFEMETSAGDKLKGKLGSLYQQVVLDAFSNYGTGQDEYVLVQGVLKRDRDDRLKEFEKIEHVTALDPLDTMLRLGELGELADGWLNGKGKAPTKENLSWFQAAFESNFGPDLPLPYLYPTPEAGIQAEWSMGIWEASLDINFNNKTGYFHALNLSDESERQDTFALEASSGWEALNAQLELLFTNDAEERSSGN
jgi:hypothetical protein